MARFREADIFDRGSHFTPRALSSPGKGRKVIKESELLLDREEAEEFRKTHEVYVRMLEEGGIRLVPSELQVIKEGAKYRIAFIQEYIPPHRMASAIFREAAPGEVLGLFKKMLRMTLGFHRAALPGVSLNFDPKPQNFCIRGGEPHLFDTYPPIIRIGGEVMPSNARKLLSQSPKNVKYKAVFSPAAKMLDAITRLDRRRLAGRLVRRNFGTPERSFSSLLVGSIRVRPDLAKDFREATKEELRGAYGKVGEKIYAAAAKRAGKLRRWGILKKTLRK